MPSTPVKRTVACQECHKKKIKCNGGGPPCRACEVSQVDCIYPVRDRKTKVGQRYLERVLEENRRLADIVSSLGSPEAAAPRHDNADRNPLIEEQPWFVPIQAVELPVHIGEAADAAFATRLRQAVSREAVNHMPRTHYMSDDSLRALRNDPPLWPSGSRLRFLVGVALDTICKRWHIVRRSSVLANVNKLLLEPESCDWLIQCQIWALLAVGEAFSSRCALPNTSFPGARYWTKAMALINIAPERPRLEVVEVHLLLAFYASCLNRRHSSITLASAAIRLCVILGLHLEIDETQLRDRDLREHRCRLWWTAYRYDRLWASKIGWPPSIPDECIEIGLPSNESLSIGDFGDAEYLTGTVKLAGLLNSAVNTLYVRKRQVTPFSERVQAAIRALREWAGCLPPRLRLDTTAPESHVLYMHLAFNQAVIVITRPVLLHLLRQRRLQDEQPFPETALSLTTACVRSARQSMSLLQNAWTDGTFHTFDYFETQFLFSSASILALSAFLRGPTWMEDREDFLLANTFLHQLELNGNFGAKEFCTHADAVEALLTREDETIVSSEPALSGPPLQDFLTNSELDLDIGEHFIDWQDVFLPEMQLPQG